MGGGAQFCLGEEVMVVPYRSKRLDALLGPFVLTSPLAGWGPYGCNSSTLPSINHHRPKLDMVDERFCRLRCIPYPTEGEPKPRADPAVRELVGGVVQSDRGVSEPSRTVRKNTATYMPGLRAK